MSANSKIEWTDHTFNPWWGCTKVGPGCDHCYAEALDKRTGGSHWGPHADRRRTKDWSGPRRWNKNAGTFEFAHGRRQRVFCASMADVFDNQVPIEWRTDLWQLIRETPKLHWLLVTKRIGNAPGMVPPDWPHAFHHVTLLISVVNQEEADRDVPKLLAMPAARRGISAEPLLGPIDFTDLSYAGMRMDALVGYLQGGAGYPTPQRRRIDWVIAGGESGTGARPMHPEWPRAIRDACVAAGVPFFFKQWGEWMPVRSDPHGADDFGKIYWPAESVDPTDAAQPIGRNVRTQWVEPRQHSNGALVACVGKARAGRLLDGREWNDMPLVNAPEAVA